MNSPSASLVTIDKSGTDNILRYKLLETHVIAETRSFFLLLVVLLQSHVLGHAVHKLLIKRTYYP